MGQQSSHVSFKWIKPDWNGFLSLTTVLNFLCPLHSLSSASTPGSNLLHCYNNTKAVITVSSHWSPWSDYNILVGVLISNASSLSHASQRHSIHLGLHGDRLETTKCTSIRKIEFVSVIEHKLPRRVMRVTKHNSKFSVSRIC